MGSNSSGCDNTDRSTTVTFFSAVPVYIRSSRTKKSPRNSRPSQKPTSTGLAGSDTVQHSHPSHHFLNIQNIVSNLELAYVVDRSPLAQGGWHVRVRDVVNVHTIVAEVFIRDVDSILRSRETRSPASDAHRT